MKRLVYVWAVFVVVAAAMAQDASKAARPKTVVFVCEHGAARSVMAASYFNQLAAERHLPFHAVARGTAPQEDLSKAAVAGLNKEGVPVTTKKPQKLTNAEARSAVRVVAFCPIPPELAKGAKVEHVDAPAPGDGWEQSRDAVFKQVRELVDQLAARR